MICAESRKYEFKKLPDNFIDCVYGQYPENNDIKMFGSELIYRLPAFDISRLASVLAIEFDGKTYVVKIRFAYEDANGKIDIKKIHDEIKESNFIVLSRVDYCGIGKHENIVERTRELIKPGANVLFKL